MNKNELLENDDCETKLFHDLVADLFAYIDESIEAAKNELFGESGKKDNTAE